MSQFTRRQFLSQTFASTALLSLSGAAPQLLQRIAAAESGQEDRLLVVIQLSGGNDGLNTLVPFTNEAYRKARPTLGIPTADVLKLTDELGLHPALKGAAQLLEQDKLAIVQGVGYEQPNRSHFESMDIWHTCQRKEDRRREGWLGKYLETPEATAGDDAPGLHLGEEVQPLALAARGVRVPSVASLERFRLKADGSLASLPEEIRHLAQTTRQQSDDLLGFVQSSTVAALSASQRVEKVLESASSQASYPATQLGEKLKTVGQLIAAGLRTRVYYVALDGFDTHSQQPAVHAALLGQWSDALQAFLADLTAAGHDQRVTVLTFSEFGRRVQENASEGTDHGAAAPIFLAGSKVKPGIHGALPSLEDLDDGDQKFHTDFRQVYATILENWLGVASAPILHGSFSTLPLL